MTHRQWRGWLIVACMFACYFTVIGAIYGSFGVVFNPLLKEFGWSRTKLSAVISMLSISVLFLSTPVGWLLDHFEARYTIVGGLAVAALGCLIAGRAHSYSPFLLASLLMGLGTLGAGILATPFVVANWFTERRGVAMGLAFSGQGLGVSVMVLINSYIVQNAGWRAVYFTMAVPLLALILPIVILVRGRPPEQAVKRQVPDRSFPGTLDTELAGLEFGVALRSRSFWLLVSTYLVYGIITGGVATQMVPYMIALGYSVTRAAQIQAASTMLHLVGNPIFGWMCDRTGARVGLCITYLLYAACFVFMALARYPAMAAGFTIINGVSQGAILLIIPMVAAECFGLRRYGSIMGALQVSYGIGATIGPILIGLIFDLTQSYLLAPKLYGLISLAVAFAAFGCVPMAAAPAVDRADQGLVQSEL